MSHIKVSSTVKLNTLLCYDKQTRPRAARKYTEGRQDTLAGKQLYFEALVDARQAAKQGCQQNRHELQQSMSKEPEAARSNKGGRLGQLFSSQAFCTARSILWSAVATLCDAACIVSQYPRQTGHSLRIHHMLCMHGVAAEMYRNVLNI